MNIVSGSVFTRAQWMGGGRGEGQPHLVEGCLNAGPLAGVVTRLACRPTCVYLCWHTPAVFDQVWLEVGPASQKCERYHAS